MEKLSVDPDSGHSFCFFSLVQELHQKGLLIPNGSLFCRRFCFLSSPFFAYVILWQVHENTPLPYHFVLAVFFVSQMFS